ncbi:hypothetical protein EUX98_g7895 [Antrodiella citrinella]|uniref:Uncharacterized protein n=1 Tax=Antrodiella citrinella TaxID=2447956 RepID=A0A4S4MEC0_9APHY|nr:hypothetical protein EUX98_g7895 [Antrodiella citrinella]
MDKIRSHEEDDDDDDVELEPQRQDEQSSEQANELDEDDMELWKDFKDLVWAIDSRDVDRDAGKILQPFKKAGMYCVRALGLFSSLAYWFPLGMQFSEASDSDSDDEDFEDDIIPTRKEACFVYAKLCQICPQLERLLPLFKMPGNEAALTDLLYYMDDKARHARTNDLGSLRYDAMTYLMPVDGFEPFLPSNRDKSKRLIDDFDSRPQQFCEDVLNGKIAITHEDYPMFVYDVDEADDSGQGLLKGPFLLACFRHIFTGGRTATKLGDGLSSGKACNAQIHGMMRVHPRHIAYIATLARFILNAQPSWDATDDKFEGRAFYYDILGLLDSNDKSKSASEKKWIWDTLAWWDLKIFNRRVNTSDHGAQQNGKVISSRSRLTAAFAAMDNAEAQQFVAMQRGAARHDTESANGSRSSTAQLDDD